MPCPCLPTGQYNETREEPKIFLFHHLNITLDAMRKKMFEYGIGGLFIGLILGVLAGVSEITYVKKSMRSEILPYAIGLSAVFFAIGGYGVGSKIGKEAYITERLGINTPEEHYYKEGRYWVGVTNWTDRRNNVKNSLVTTRGNTGELVTVFNGNLIYNHQIRNANQQTVPRYHQRAKNELFKKMKDDFKE